MDWEQHRAGLFEQARREWRRTPWSDIRGRQLILMFNRSFIRKDRAGCRNIARKLLRRVTWSEDRNEYIQNLPPYRRDNYYWVFHAIGLLMLAALPIQNFILLSRYELDVTYRFIPRKETPEELKGRREVSRTRLKDDREIPPRELYDPLGRPGEVIDADHSYHEDYLDVLGRLIDYLASNDVVVCHAWLRAILNTAEDLRRQRRDVVRNKRSWAEAWRFLIPAYSTSLSRWRDGRWTVISVDEFVHSFAGFGLDELSSMLI